MRVELPILCFLSLPLLLWSLPNHVHARNIAIITLILTLFLVNLIRGINTIIWRDDVIIRLLVWCDITTKFMVGATIALPASTLCISRQLARVANPNATLQAAVEKRRRQIFETFLCVGYPCLVMALHYVVQGHRFDIVQEFGCTPTIYRSIPALFIATLPPLVLATISMVYASAALFRLVLRRATFPDYLRQNHGTISPGGFYRLMSLAWTEIILQFGFSAYLFVSNVRHGLEVWDNWADVHWGFSAVWQVTKADVPASFPNEIEATFIAPVLGSLFCFTFFGLSRENLAANKRLWAWLTSRLLIPRVRLTAGSSILPTHRPSTVERDLRSAEKASDDSSPALDTYSWHSSAAQLASTWSEVRPSTPDKGNRTSDLPSPDGLPRPEQAHSDSSLKIP